MSIAQFGSILTRAKTTLKCSAHKEKQERTESLQLKSNTSPYENCPRFDVHFWEALYATRQNLFHLHSGLWMNLQVLSDLWEYCKTHTHARKHQLNLDLHVTNMPLMISADAEIQKREDLRLPGVRYSGLLLNTTSSYQMGSFRKHP